MHDVSEMYRSARGHKGQQLIAAALAILGSICTMAGAQIDITQTGLHGGESVYGLYAPPTPVPYVNLEAIILFASGETNPDLYADVSFYAYGLYSDASLINSGAIDVNAVGGNAYAANSSIVNAGVSAYSIYTLGGVTNTGDIRITAAGGTANAESDAGANARGNAYGLYSASGVIANSGQIDVAATGGTASSESIGFMNPTSAAGLAYGSYIEDGQIDNSGKVTVTALGGLASADYWVDVKATAYGMFDDNGETANSGDITVTAIGGTGHTSQGIEADADATGLSINGNVSNTGDLAIAATGGTATTDSPDSSANVYARGEAEGITAQGTVNNSGTITAIATGRMAESKRLINPGDNIATAFAGARGIFAADGADNSGHIIAAATGGTASADGDAEASTTAGGIRVIRAYGILNNSGDVTVTATSGTATGSRANTIAEAYGLDGDDVNNTGAVAVVATGGTAVATGGAYAYSSALGIDGGLPGVESNNTGAISVAAVGGTATGSDAHANAEAIAMDVSGNMYNSGVIAAYAIGGTATPDPGIADANASAYGFEMLYGNVNNGGAMTVVARGGTADANHLDALASAKGLAYGVYATHSPITNGGQIDVQASGGTALSGAAGLTLEASASGQAYGLYAEDDAIGNTGRITVAAQGGHASAPGDVNAAAVTYGVLAPLAGATNSGNISVTAAGGTGDTGSSGSARATATGLSTKGNLDNTGDLTVAALGGTATTDGHSGPAYADTDATTTAVFTQGMVNNSGTIQAAATGGTATANSIASPYVGAFADAFTIGVRAPSSAIPVGVNNSGDIAATATGGTAVTNNSGTAYATAFGIWTAATLINNGNVSVTATGGTVTGVNASTDADALGLDGLNINNSGAVTVIATGGTAHAEDVADTGASAEGLAAGNVTNSGAISVTASAGTATGDRVRADVYAFGISAGTNVQNSGPITVTATTLEGSTSQAYGIRMNSFGNVTNTGVIRATGDTAYELYVADCTTWLVGTYNVTLDGDPNRASLGVANGATLSLNGATLTVTAVDHETLWNRPYRLFATDGNGVVNGSFAGVRAINPNTTATYRDQGTAASVDDTVALAYTPVASPTLASEQVQQQAIAQAGDVINRHMTTTLLQDILNPLSSGLLVDAGPTAESLALAEAASDKTSGAFVEPYYSRLNRDADPLGFNASLWGFSAGYERYVENTLLSLHLGYGQSDIDYTGHGYSGNSEDQDIVTGGLSGLTRWDPWTLRYGLTGFYGQHDYEGLTGLALDERETASYDSYGTAATLMAGHILQWNQHVFLPEVGLNWFWTHRPRFTTEATDPAWDTTYAATDDHDLQTAASLRWLSSFLWREIRVSPSASLGVRHLLTDAETSVWQSVEGAAPVLVRSKQDRTAMTLSGSLTLTRIPHVVSLAYDGEYSSDAQLHSLWLRYSFLF